MVGGRTVLAQTVGLAMLVGMTAGCGPTGPTEAVVTKIVDGDTLDVEIDGSVERIRLLNIDAPEVTEPDVECLGPEASELLMSLIPVGTEVALEYDVERTDPYDRTLAGVYTGSGTFVNAEVARAGLATAVVFGANDRFLPEVERAQAEAQAAGRGLHSAEVECTVPGRVEALVAAAAAIVPVPAGAGSAQITGLAVAAAGVVSTATALQQELLRSGVGVVSAVLTDERRADLSELVDGVRVEAERAEDELRSAASAAADREAEEARVAREQAVAEQERIEQERRAAERARETEWAAEADRAARDVPARNAVVDPPSSGSGPYPGYTGPRCYAPGGRTYTPC